MQNERIVIGFAGAGGIARAHAFALNSLKFYYDDAPETEFGSVCSQSGSSERFARLYGFSTHEDPGSFKKNERLNTIFILGPNKVHFDFFSAAIALPSVTRIYLEKPVCSTEEEEKKILGLSRSHPDKKIQVGFQYLFSSQIMGALSLWQSGILGRPVHFDLKYYHGDYLRKDYRDKRASRLTQSPDGGAMADLGSHIISLLIAFLGSGIKVVDTVQSGNFPDVQPDTDLFSMMTVYDPVTKAAGTLSSSRISSGTGDLISFELFAEKGAIRFSTHAPDSFEYYLEEEGIWKKQVTGSNYGPFTSFPSGHVPPGWLRSMIHSHYIFLTGKDPGTVVPDIYHGLEVQRILRISAKKMKLFRQRAGEMRDQQ